MMEIYDKDPIVSLKTEIVNKIKKDNIVIDESKTFDEIVDLMALKDKQKLLKKDKINSDPATKILYDQLKNLPFSVVRKIYLNKDSLIDDKKQSEGDDNKKGSKRDNLIKHLFKIQTVVDCYKNKKFNEFIRSTEYQIDSIAKKTEIRDIVDKIENMSKSSIDEVISFADSSGICKKDDKLSRFIIENEYLYNRIKILKFEEFQNLFYYLEGYTPFSTQHKIKGAEFNNVLVILDNGKWNDYNFEYLFCNRTDKQSVLSRTQKIFYVCCTRSKENLTVYYHNPSDIVIQKAKEWFGEKNVIKI